MQVYRFMDIGTAKPPEALRRRLPHHLINILNPDQQFHTGEFKRKCDELVPEISSRGFLPVISGGTRLLFQKLSFRFARNPGIRSGNKKGTEIAVRD